MIRSAQGPPHLATLILLSALSVLSLNLFLPSLNNIARDFSVDYSVISLAVAGYLAVNTVLQVLIGPLSDHYGRRPVLLVAVGVFIVASLGCLLADSVAWFLGLRMLQSAMAAGGVLSLAIVRDILPERQAASRIGYLSMAMGVGPMVGPVIGGGLDELFGWRATFGLYLLMGLLVFAVCWFDLGETNRNRSADFAVQFRSYPALARSKSFWGHALCAAFSTAAFYVFVSAVPLIATASLGLSAGQLGLGIGSITAGFIVGSFLSGRFAGGYRLSTMMIAGRVVGVAGLVVGLLLAWAGIINVYALFGSTLFIGVGNGLTMPSAYSGAISARPALAGSASGFTGALVVGFGAVFTSLAGILLPGEFAIEKFLCLLLFCNLSGLAAALYVRRQERP